MGKSTAKSSRERGRIGLPPEAVVLEKAEETELKPLTLSAAGGGFALFSVCVNCWVVALADVVVAV